jgi:hypothetical protein
VGVAQVALNRHLSGKLSDQFGVHDAAIDSFEGVDAIAGLALRQVDLAVVAFIDKLHHSELL